MSAGPYSIGSSHWPGLSKLLEECGEVQQVIGKLIATNGVTAHWDEAGDLRDRIEEEIADVLAAAAFVVDVNGLDWSAINTRSDRKKDLFQRWQREQSATTEGRGE